MKKITVAIPLAEQAEHEQLVASLKSHQAVGQTIAYSPQAIPAMLEETAGKFLLLILPGGRIELGAQAVERLLQVAEDTQAGLIYPDFRERHGAEVIDHPLIDYQVGSVRDNFDFGSVLFLSIYAVRHALAIHGDIPEDVRWGGLYDLRLKLSIDAPILRLPEPLYTRSVIDQRTSGEKIFDYVDPRQRDSQIEMERIVTSHLQRIGAWLEPVFQPAPETNETFPVQASIVIPVRNRVKTIADAVKSALSQVTDFPYNVLVVDNHSTDGTTDILREMSLAYNRLIHLQPQRDDLGIGGCWNMAVYSPVCGRYAVQLDSDDLYRDEHTLARVVGEFQRGRHAMIIGSYHVVDFDLQEIPPGLIDHREWTRENGRNNALRINGLGAPRAFDVGVLRRMGLPNVSYVEDYAVALRLSREHEIGRIYDSLYYARRWSGNSDSALPLATSNRYDAYKDRLRSIEIAARQHFNLRRQKEWR